MKEVERVKSILTKRLDKVTHLKEKVEISLAKAPAGSLILSSSNGTTQYFHKKEKHQKKGEYISKKNQNKINMLAQKDYNLKFLKELEKEKKGLEEILKKLPEDRLDEVYENLSEQRKLLVTPYVLSDAEYVEEWKKISYTGKNYYENTASFITERGECVRSKSEKIIADKLYYLGIPYHYEKPVKLKEFGVVYPDFTMLNVSERKEIYLEHFGMMDDADYCQKAILKIREYARNGIFINDRLLVTFETLKTPLNMRDLEILLEEFVLK